MNYKLYVLESGLFDGIKRIIYVENNDEVFEYFSPSNILKFDEHFYNTKFYTDYEPFAEFNNRKDLFDVMYYLTTSNKNSKRYKKIIENKKLYEYLI